MADQLYSQFADIKKIEAQKKEILKIFGEIKTATKDLSRLGVRIDSSKSVKEVAAALAALEKSKKAYMDLQVKYEKIQEKVNQTSSKGVKLSLEEKLANQEALKIQKERIRLRQAEQGSQEQLNLQYNKAVRILNGLSEAQRNSSRGQNLTKFAEDLDKKLKGIDARVGSFRRNVGNYSNSLADGFNMVAKEIEKLKTKQQELTQIKGFQVGKGEDTSGVDAELTKTTSAINELNKVMAIGEDTGSTFNQTVRKIGFSFQNLATNGNVSNEFLDDFKKFAAEAKDEADDLRQEIKALSSDTRGFDLLSGALSTVASGFEAVAGVQALAGDQNEDLQKSIQKLVAIQSIANGVREVATQITTRGTAANKLYNFIMAQTAIVTNSASTATARFSAILKLTGIGLLITGLAFLASKLLSVGDSASKASEGVGELAGDLKELDSISNRLTKNLERQNSLRISSLKASGASQKTISQETLNGLQKEKKLTEDIALATLQRVNASKSTRDKIKDEADAIKTLQIAEAIMAESGDKMDEKEKSRRESRIKGLTAIVQAFDDVHKKEVEIQVFSDQLKADEISKRRALTKQEKEDALELFKFRQNQIVEQKEFEASNESILTTDDKIKAAIESAKAQKAIIIEQTNFDLEQEGITAYKRKLIIEQSAKAIEDVEFQLSGRIFKIRYDFLRREQEAAKQGEEDFKADMEGRLSAAIEASSKQFEKEQSQQEIFKNQEIRAVNERIKAGEITIEEGNKRKEQIELSYQKTVLDAQIRFYERQVELLDANGQDTTAMLAAIAKAKADLSGLDIDTSKKTAQEIKDINQSITENYIDSFQQIADAYSNILGEMAEARKSEIDEQINDIERIKEADIARVSTLTENEEKKAARIKIIEARAQSQKEQLERRQRQIDRQRAITERSFKAFQITTDTIQGVNKIRLLIAAAPDPVTKALYTSQLILAIASGAASLTALLATPLPKFYTGVKSAPGGFAHVAEKGRELAVEPGGRTKLYDSPSIQYIKRGTRIYNNEQTEKIIKEGESTRSSMYVNSAGSLKEVVYDERLLEETKEVKNQLKELNKKPPITIVNQRGIESTPWYQQQMKY